VITHRPPAPRPDPTVEFVFITDGIAAAVDAAKQAAGDRYATIGGGADIARQALAAGLVDELQLHAVPLLVGRGVRLFDRSIMDGSSPKFACSMDRSSPTSAIGSTAHECHRRADLHGAGSRRSGDSPSIVETPSKPIVRSSSATMFSMTWRTPSAPPIANP
jgi:RibD C-terminal domain